MTSTERTPAWSERWNPRNWTLAWKLAAIGLVPTLLALTLGVLRIADQSTIATDLGQGNRLLEVREQAAAAADALRLERDQAALFVGASRIGDRGSLETGFGTTDTEIAEFRGTLDDTIRLDPATAEALERADEGIAALTDLRADANGNFTTPTADVISRYSAIIGRVDALDRALLRQLQIPEVAGLADALSATTEASEQLALQHTVLGAAIRAGQLRPEDTALANATRNAVTAAYSEYEGSLTREQAERFGDFLGNPATSRRELIRNAILATPQGRPVTASPTVWDTAYTESQAAVDTSGEAIFTDLRTGTTAAEEQASNLAGIASVVLLLGLLVAVAVVLLMARALIRSLRVLRSSALDVAERTLPQAVASMRAGETPDVTVDPVPLSGRDEIVQVARAFDVVHGQAVRLAADQAALQSNVSSMFVNLSRRSQALVERQLQLIEQLESNEQDPDQLSNLFQLDHLATRMRRNSENLLVLAGTDLAKRNVAPVPMVDVLRAAVSEIEQYQRIVVQTPPTATIVGRAASDLVHLLAELLDNATNFSPPDSTVVMSSSRPADGSILVEIADRGVGMIDHELSDANQRLGGPNTVDVSASRRMGLFVVGRLAARHGIGVRLGMSSAGGPGGGLTASVTVPSYLVPSLDPGTPRRAPAPTPAADTPSAPPQRSTLNGHGRAGSLSSLVAGTSGPLPATRVFEPMNGPSRGDGAPHPRLPVNGVAVPLPTRIPGSSRRPEGAGSTWRSKGAGSELRPESPAGVEPSRDGTPRLDTTRPDAADVGNGAAPSPNGRLEVSPTTPRDDPAPATDRRGPAAPPTAPMSVTEPPRRSSAKEFARTPQDSRTLPVRPDGPPIAPQHQPTPPRPVDAGRGPDCLFAPSVPAIAEFDTAVASRRPGPEFGGAGQFELGETTPIFEEIASAWFRSNRPVPVSWRAQDQACVPVDQHPETPQASAAPAARPTDPQDDPPPTETTPAPVPAGPEPPEGPPEPAEPRPDEAAQATSGTTGTEAPADAPAPAERGFAGVADEGWRAASDIENAGDSSEGLTEAGLPKRRPRARLLPGSADAAVAPLAPSPLAPSRSADGVRGRLASYQQGVRQGRETRLRRDIGHDTSFPVGGGPEHTSPAGTHDEEFT